MFETQESCDSALHSGNFTYYEPKYFGLKDKNPVNGTTKVRAPLETDECIPMLTVSGWKHVVQKTGTMMRWDVNPDGSLTLYARDDCGNPARRRKNSTTTSTPVAGPQGPQGEPGVGLPGRDGQPGPQGPPGTTLIMANYGSAGTLCHWGRVGVAPGVETRFYECRREESGLWSIFSDVAGEWLWTRNRGVTFVNINGRPQNFPRGPRGGGGQVNPTRPTTPTNPVACKGKNCGGVRPTPTPTPKTPPTTTACKGKTCLNTAGVKKPKPSALASASKATHVTSTVSKVGGSGNFGKFIKSAGKAAVVVAKRH